MARAKKPSTTPVTALVPTSVHAPVDFKATIEALLAGKSIRRLAWPEEEYGVMRAGFLHIHRNGEFHIWKVSDGDLLGTDWVIF